MPSGLISSISNDRPALCRVRVRGGEEGDDRPGVRGVGRRGLALTGLT